jgi:hypothetical protein
MKKLFVLAAALVASASGFAFQPTDSKSMVDAEVRQRTQKGETLSVIASAAKLGGIKTDVLACSLLAGGSSAADVVASMVRGGFDAAMVINGATCNGANRDALVAVANRENSDASGGLSAGGLGGNGSGGAGVNFGITRASTVGGGGRNSVSGS